MEKYHTLKDLAPRDVVARSILREMIQQKTPHVYLDATHLDKNRLQSHFPTIVENCLTVGIDPLKDPIPVIPAAHYSCGGIEVDEYSKTSMHGLYAIGECSHTGLHGANRLASNSLLESIVFSHRAALDSASSLKNSPANEQPFPAIPAWQGHGYSEDNHSQVTATLREQLTQIMSEQVGIFKTSAGLVEAQNSIKKLYFEVVGLYNENKLSPQLCELRNMVSVAYVLVNQSVNINENKGVFYNHNFAYV